MSKVPTLALIPPKPPAPKKPRRPDMCTACDRLIGPTGECAGCTGS